MIAAAMFNQPCDMGTCWMNVLGTVLSFDLSSPFFYSLSSSSSLLFTMPFFSTFQNILASFADDSSLYSYSSPPLSPQRHSNSPSSSTLENLSRTIRDYVPSSIHIPVPTAGPSPPLVSRPIVSYAQFSGSPTTSSHQRSPTTPHKRTASQQQEFEREYEREGEFGYGYSYGNEYAQPQPQRAAMLVQSPRVQHSPPPGGFPGSGLAQAMRRGAAGMTESFIGRGSGRGEGRIATPASKHTLVNEKGKVDAISWARWDVLNGRCVFSVHYSVNN